MSFLTSFFFACPLKVLSTGVEAGDEEEEVNEAGDEEEVTGTLSDGATLHGSSAFVSESGEKL